MKIALLFHEEKAGKLFEERKNLDISHDRIDLLNILAVGRLHFDKNFHGLLQAFKENKQLNSRANLIFVINGPKDSNENYILLMQKALAEGRTSLDGFSGSALEQLIRLAELLRDKELSGKWTAVSLPDGRDYAGLQRYLGKQGKTVSGLFSFKEPYGLAPWESVFAGIPVVVSDNAGVAEELAQAGAKTFNPVNHFEIAKALNETFDNYNEIKVKLTSCKQNKSWFENAKRIKTKLENSSLNIMEDSRVEVINVDDPSFVEKGKNLIFITVEQQLKKKFSGDFKDLF